MGIDLILTYAFKVGEPPCTKAGNLGWWVEYGVWGECYQSPYITSTL